MKIIEFRYKSYRTESSPFSHERIAVVYLMLKEIIKEALEVLSVAFREFKPLLSWLILTYGSYLGHFSQSGWFLSRTDFSTGTTNLGADSYSLITRQLKSFQGPDILNKFIINPLYSTTLYNTHTLAWSLLFFSQFSRSAFHM